METVVERYIGDGVYAKVEAGVIKLHTERGSGTHYIYLGLGEIEALNEFVKTIKEGGL